MDERRHVDELDRGRGANRGGTAVGPGAEQYEQRPQSLPPAERVAPAAASSSSP